jgi:concanavalin A-like lectin/glucanase superfamily protein
MKPCLSPAFVLLVLLTSVLSSAARGEPWRWQRSYSEVLPDGDIRLAQRPFVFVAGDSLRYIDFAGGDDDNPGTKQRPWKHHPWDSRAEGRAAKTSGVHTYVFKRGAVYRGSLIAKESGKPGDPIRLTTDPSWGEGDAVLAGSERVTGWTRGADHPDIPQPGKVWCVDLDWLPRNVWMVGTDGEAVRISLAREPNWTWGTVDDVKAQWWQWNNPRKPWDFRKKVGNAEMHMAFDTKHLTRPKEHYEGAYVWPEYGWVMGTPYPTRVREFDEKGRSMVFGGQWGSSAGSYHIGRYCRYFLDDKPHYLDDGNNGEFWFHRKGKGGRLYLRLPGDADPNRTHIEVARRLNLIDSEHMSHVHITGLAFRFTNVLWDLDALPTRSPDVDPACIRLLGAGEDLAITHCRFEHVHMGIRLKAAGKGAAIDRVRICDNVFSHTDHGAMIVADGGAWGVKYPDGRLYDVEVLRNSMYRIGMRPSRYGQGHAMDIECAQTAHIAGNVGTELFGSGIFVHGAKRNASHSDRPLSRILIHQNKITHSLLNNNDWGGIETWQGGPAYVFNNVSGNPGGYKMWGHRNQPDRPGAARFGHAYYMDGGYKQYYFNNIAWGKSSDPMSPLGNTAAFQEIHGYFCDIFNNTVYNFVKGSRRQAPQAGCNKYMGNIWHTIGDMVFRHAEPSGRQADPNAQDAGTQGSKSDHATNAYHRNVFYRLPKRIAAFEPNGQWYATVEGLAKAMASRGTIGDLGQSVDDSPLVDPAGNDFRPTASAKGSGVKAFVPWSLYATVAEWHFHHAGKDPAHIGDESWYMTPYHINRTRYHQIPRTPLRGVNVKAEDYVAGPLENWTRGALQLNGTNQYAVVRGAALRGLGAGETPESEDSYEGGYKSPLVDTSNLLIEAYFRTEPGHTGGVLLRNLGAAGYELRIGEEGKVVFRMKGAGQEATIASRKRINDGRWHHVISEADRKMKTLTLYVDGKRDASGPGLGPVSLSNEADLYVGGTPEGQGLAGTLEFMRVCLGTLADARTTIEELYAWELDGPFLRDFTGQASRGKDGCAGALEAR